MKKNLKIKLFFLASLVFFSQSILAANLELEIKEDILKTDETFVATIFLDTEGKFINTIEGDFKYDEKFLKAEAVNIGNSFVSFWMEKPNKETAGIVRFSGIVPGGISTSRSEAFEVIFKTQTSGSTELLLENVHLLLNDGEGSEVKTKIKNISLKITPEKITQDESKIVSDDKTSPEQFKITRSRSPYLFDNKWFIVFGSADKGSGIDHYEVCELFKCLSAESPFLLENQTPFYYLKVKAYDLNGNLTSATLTSVWSVGLFIVLLFSLLGLVSYISRKYL